MKFYHLTCHTPFVGEEADFYIKSFDESDLRRQIVDCVFDNGEEITKEEYLKNCPWDKEVA
jgi:hypothetical protein